MITMTTSSSSSVNPLTLVMGPPLLSESYAGPLRGQRFPSCLLVDAELHGRHAGLMRADVGCRGGIVEVRDAQALAEPRARGRELVHAPRLARPAVAARVDRLSGRSVLLGSARLDRAVEQVVVKVDRTRADRGVAAVVAPALQDVVPADGVGQRLGRARRHDSAGGAQA